MASEKKTPARHLAQTREDMGAQHAELLAMVSEFRAEVATSFRVLREKLEVVTRDWRSRSMPR